MVPRKRHQRSRPGRVHPEVGPAEPEDDTRLVRRHQYRVHHDASFGVQQRQHQGNDLGAGPDSAHEVGALVAIEDGAHHVELDRARRVGYLTNPGVDQLGNQYGVPVQLGIGH